MQLAYEAWMSNAKTALNIREQDEIRNQRNKKEEERKNEQLPGVERGRSTYTHAVIFTRLYHDWLEVENTIF